MPPEIQRRLVGAENYDFVRGLFAQQVARGELELPVLPEVAARIVAVAADPDSDAAALARLVAGDQALAAHVLRVATSAAYQPRRPIESLQQAIAWLGMAEVRDVAFTVAVQGKLLNVPGQRARVQRLWKLSVAAALWARAVADAASRESEASYLGGLLHEIGKPVCLQAVAELSRRAAAPLGDTELESLVAEFHVEVGAQLAERWKLPEGVATVVRWWSHWAEAPARREQCAIVHLAHHLAEHMFAHSGSLAADALAEDPAAQLLGLGLPELLLLCGQSEQLRVLVDGY